MKRKAYGTDSAWKQLLEQEKKRIGLNTDQLFYVNQIKLKLQVLKEHTLQQESTKNITHLFFLKRLCSLGIISRLMQHGSLKHCAYEF